MNVDELLDVERRRGGFSRDERDAMWRGIQRSIGAAGVAAAATATAATAKAATAKAASAATAAPAAKLATWKLAGLLSAVAIGGAGVGAAAHAHFATPKIVEVQVPAPSIVATAPPPAATPSETITPPPTASSPPAVQPRARTTATASATATATAAKDPSLARERTLLDMARTALSRGDASGALASLDTHAREFPSSQLAEEREVLAIQALSSAGRKDEARKRASAFKARFVNSPLRSIVDEATQ
jgi:hypothetical protein